MSNFMIPASTFISKSVVVPASLPQVWKLISSGRFQWWSLVANAELVEGASPLTLDATIRIIFKDGVSWIVAVRSLSNLSDHSITYEMISCEPAIGYSSAVHTISLKSVSTGGTFVEWSTVFSNDATAEIVTDASFKREEALSDLAKALI